MIIKIITTTILLGIFNIAISNNTETFREKLLEIDPSAENAEIIPSQIENYYQVTVNDNLYYIEKNLEHMFIGEGFDLSTGYPRSVYIDVESEYRERLLSFIRETDTIVFGKGNEHKLYVFTDITCPFCQRFHRDIERIVNLNVEVNYIPFPREGLGGNVEKALNYIWCSDNREEEYKKAISSPNNYINKENNINNICSPYITAQYFTLANKLDIIGTPFILSTDGDILGGYDSFNNFQIRIKNKYGVSNQ